MTCTSAAALGAQGSPQLRQDAQAALRAEIGELMRPKSDQGGQVAIPLVAAGASLSHPIEDVRRLRVCFCSCGCTRFELLFSCHVERYPFSHPTHNAGILRRED
jgi:hypothetical protein